MPLPENARVLIVANPMARRNAPRLMADFKNACPDTYSWTIVETSPRALAFGELEDQARQSDVVVSIGGDGTVTETLTAIGSAPTPIAILPGGSTNVIAQELSLSGNPLHLARLLTGEYVVQTMDAAVCNDRIFLHMAGAGFDSRIFDQANPDLKRRVGWFAYLPSAAQSLRLPPARFHVQTENAEFALTSPMVLVANGAGIIRPSLYVFPGISSTDGWLDLIAITATRPQAIAGVLARFALRSMDRSPHILHARAREIRIDADPPMPVQVDGDIVGSTSVDIHILPQRANLVVPPQHANHA